MSIDIDETTHKNSPCWLAGAMDMYRQGKKQDTLKQLLKAKF